MHRLTGKLETMMCLILQLESEMTERIISVTAQVLATNVHYNQDCSTRQVRSCTVLQYARETWRILALMLN